MDTYIEKLHVKNIGLFDELEVEFNPRMNIIIGNNGSGKTSILRSLIYCFALNNLSYSRWRNHAEAWIDLSLDNHKLRVGFMNIGETNSAYKQYPFKDGFSISNPPHNESHQVLNTTQLKDYKLFVISAYRHLQYQSIQPTPAKEVVGEQRNQTYLYNAVHLLEGETNAIPNTKQWMINRYFVMEKDWASNEKKNWDTVQSFLSKTAPSGSDFKFLRIERDLEPIFSLNGKECYLEELSSGFKSFLMIAYSIVDWCEGVNTDDKALIENAEGTVLIDEIDAHLHPEWQAKIIHHLKDLFPKLQFIVTTHSPHVIASAEAGEILNIPPHNGTLHLKPNPNSYKGWQLDYILEDVMKMILPQEIEIGKTLEKINKAIDKNDLGKYDEYMSELAGTLHPDDPILQVYKLKKTSLLLNQD
jgi:AAA ATPase domain